MQKQRKNWRDALLSKDQLTDCLHKKRLSRQDIILTILFVDSEQPKNVQTIKTFGRNAGFTEILKWNVSDILRKSRGLAINVPHGWSLTSKGKSHIESLNILPLIKSPKIINLAKQLRDDLKKISSQDSHSFLEEAIICFETRLYRACVIMSWVGAISILYDYVINYNLAEFNAEAQRRDPKWKNAKVKDDLSKMKEWDFLDILESISIICKNVKQELQNICLTLRNACGHPNSLKIGENRVAAHLEILINNVFSKY